MTNFITNFDKNSGTIIKFNLEYKGEMIFPKDFEGIIIRIVGENSCSKGKVTKINMSNTEILKIKGCAFGGCSYLREITFPSSLQEIEANSFLQTKLERINIGANVSSMDGYAWNQIATIKSFDVDPENSYFSSEEGYLFNKEKTKLFRAPAKVTSEKDIPYIAQITSICKFAFTSTKLKRFKCTSKLNLLEDYAFHAIFSIVEVDLSLGTFTVIPKYCFYGCRATKISLPNTIKIIKTDAFYSASNLRNLIIWKNAEKIEVNAFRACPNLKAIYYAGSFDQSTVACIASDIKTDVHVTKNYSFATFCHFNVSRGWNGKIPATKICNRTKDEMLKLFIYVLLCSSR